MATTTTTAPDAARGRLRHRTPSATAAALAALAAGFALLEVGLAHEISGSAPSRVLLPVVMVLGLAAVFAFPMAATIALLFVAASIFQSSFFSASAGPIQIHAQEVLLGALAIAAVVTPRRQTWGGAAGLALAVFLGLVALSAALAVSAGRATLTDAFNWARPLVFYITFWIVLRLFPDARSLRQLLVAGLACGALTGVLAVVLQLVSSLTHTFQGNGGIGVYTQLDQSDLGGLKRIRQPGLAFSYLLFWWSVFAVMHARGRRRWMLSALAAASGIDLLLSFNRNMWIGLLLGLGIVLALVGPQARHRLSTALALCVTAALLTFTVLGNSGQSSQLDPIVARATSVLTPDQVVQESSIRDREEETAQALRAVRAHPFTGIGPGADFGVRYKQEQGDGRWYYKIQLFLHNQWIYLMLIGGVPALLAFLAFVGIVLARAWGVATRTLSGVALGAGVAMLALSALVMPYLGLPEFALALGVVAAAVIRGQELERARQAQMPAAR